MRTDTASSLTNTIGAASRAKALSVGTYAWVIVAGIFLLGLALRFFLLDAHSLWYDEVLSIDAAQRGLEKIFTDRFGWMRVQPPLHYAIVWLAAQAADPTTTAAFVRLPSALAGALLPVIVYGVGRELFGRAQGVLAALLLALSPVMLDYSTDVRPYAILTLLTACTVYCLLVARRTMSWRWWLAFAGVMSLNMFHAYVAVTLVLPAISPFMAWVLWDAWRKRAERPQWRRDLAVALGAMFLVGLVAVGVLLDSMSVPRISPDLALLPLVSLFTSPVELLGWFTQLGLDGRVGQLVNSVLVLLALFGVYSATRSGHGMGAALCSLFATVPAMILAVFATTNIVLQRYALFALPFYLLPVCNGLVTLYAAATEQKSKARLSRGVAAFAAGLSGAVVFLFALGAYSFTTPAGHTSISFRPESREVAAYLTQHARPDDTIVFLGWDNTAVDFYWKQQAPAPTYYAHDPRLFAHKVSGTIYWVAGFPGEASARLAQGREWAEVADFGKLVVLKEERATSMLSSMEAMYTDVEKLNMQDQFTLVMRGSVYQAQGDIEEAASTYRVAGAYFPYSGEYLRTAVEHAARGDRHRAWRDVMTAKGTEPNTPELHRWFAQELAASGYAGESRTELLVAEALEDLQK